MSNLIDRQAVIDVITNAADKWDCSDDYLQGIRAGIRMGTLFTSGIPSAQPETQIIHCNRCKHYQGVHKVQGHAPCSYWGTGAVLWNEYCSNAEPYREE